MFIAPITNLNIHNNYYGKSSVPEFTAHPDFYKFNSTQSCFFRRGMVSLVNIAGYAKIEKLFEYIFSQPANTPRKMLIIGIGHSQEPFSYLASIKGILKDRPLNKNVELHIVDLQSKPDLNELKRDSFSDLYDYESFPYYASRSFVKDTISNFFGIKKPENNPVELYLYNKYYNPPTPQYRVNDEIFNLVWNSYNNPQKSKWDSRIQEAILEYPDNYFDIIAANNVLPYISKDELIIRTVEHIKRTLKPEASFITDPYDIYDYPEFLNNLSKINDGIYKKI